MLTTVNLLQPVTVNRYLQGIVQHPHFFKLAAPSTSTALNPLGKIRESITSTLKTLFFLHPANTCQVSHIEPLIRVYGGTLSPADGCIIDIFQLFETQRRLSVRSIVSRWSPPSSSVPGTAGVVESSGLEALQNVDPILVLRTALAFPTLKSDDKQVKSSTLLKHQSQLYDPLFLLYLLQHVLANSPPTSAIAWIELFRSNVVGLAMRALSAKDGKVREVGMACIVGVWKHMQEADLQEREQVLYLLSLLKNALPPPPPLAASWRMDIDEEELEARLPIRLPSYISLLLFHALRGIFNPATFVYPLTSRFLLQRPELDLTDVPMLYNMLYSSDTEDWKKERSWILRFLADGILSGSRIVDWKLLKRRHVWDLVASMYQSANSGTAVSGVGLAEGAMSAAGDRALKHGVLDFLVNVTRHKGPTMSLVLKSGLLAWIEMQLTGPDRRAGYGLEWLRILENIIVVLDVKKLEASALKGIWVKTISRCIQFALQEAIGELSKLSVRWSMYSCGWILASPGSLMIVFPLATRLILRLASISSIGSEALEHTLTKALIALKHFEEHVKVASTASGASIPEFDQLIPPPQHSSHGLHEKTIFDEETLFYVWGRSVELLWQATMKVETSSKPDAWASLTSRLLVWRGVVNVESSALGEWARVECVKNLGEPSGP